MSMNRREVLEVFYKAAVRAHKHGNSGNSYPNDYFIDDSHILPRLQYYEITIVPPYTIARLFVGKPGDTVSAYGVAKCSPRDKFDIDTGCRIAIARATREWLKPTAFTNTGHGSAFPNKLRVTEKDLDINPYEAFPTYEYADLDQTKLLAHRMTFQRDIGGHSR